MQRSIRWCDTALAVCWPRDECWKRKERNVGRKIVVGAGIGLAAGAMIRSPALRGLIAKGLIITLLCVVVHWLFGERHPAESAQPK
jgi:hypothetical protein